MNKNDILDYLKRQEPYFRDNFGIHFIGLFGSFSRGNENQDSDIDILYDIDKDKKLSMFKYLRISKELKDFFLQKN